MARVLRAWFLVSGAEAAPPHARGLEGDSQGHRPLSPLGPKVVRKSRPLAGWRSPDSPWFPSRVSLDRSRFCLEGGSRLLGSVCPFRWLEECIGHGFESLVDVLGAPQPREEGARGRLLARSLHSRGFFLATKKRA